MSRSTVANAADDARSTPHGGPGALLGIRDHGMGDAPLTPRADAHRGQGHTASTADPTARACRRERTERLYDCLTIAAVAVGLLVVLRPLQNTPFIDDWIYAHSVEGLLTRGQIRIVDWSSHLNLAQILWGALFCLPFGFSFTALRASTWVLAVSALWALYLLLRDGGVSRRTALLGAATLGFNPVFFVLAYTFMSDVPFLAVMIWYMLAVTRAVRAHDRGWLWIAAGLASVGVGIRSVGVVLPGALLAVTLFSGGPWGRRPQALAAVLTSVALGSIVTWCGLHALEHVADLSGTGNAPSIRFELLLRYGFPWLPKMLVFGTAFVIVSVGTALLPLAPAVVQPAYRRGRPWLWVVVMCLAVGAYVATPPYPPPLASGETWAWAELGATEPLIPNATPAAESPWLAWSIIGVAAAAFTVALSAVLSRPAPMGTDACLLWLAFGHWVLVGLLWLFYDRYTMVFVPLAIALLLGRSELRRPRLAVPGLAAFAVLCCVGMRDHLALNQALWDAVAAVRDRGVPAEQIDGGYVVNGWLQFAHPAHAPRDANGQIVIPHMTVKDWPLPYVISLQQLPGFRAVDRVPFQRYLAPSGAVFVLQRITEVTR